MDPTITLPIYDIILNNIASSKIFNGLIMTYMNIGGKYLGLELPSTLDLLFSKYQFLRYFVIFCICFMATRDIKFAVLLALLFILIVKFALNESSVFCLVKNIKKENDIKNEELKKEKVVSKEEFEKAKEVIHKYLHNNPNSYLYRDN
jgi:hypothetical protein